MEKDRLTPGNQALQSAIRLYEELLACLHQEWDALLRADEEAILALAARKEALLQNLCELSPLTPPGEASPAGKAALENLKREVATVQERNRRLIMTALETLQDFLQLLKSAAPGLYQPSGELKAMPGNPLFYRQV